MKYRIYDGGGVAYSDPLSAKQVREYIRGFSRHINPAEILGKLRTPGSRTWLRFHDPESHGIYGYIVAAFRNRAECRKYL